MADAADGLRNEVVPIGSAKAKRFLHALAENSFVAVVMEEPTRLVVYYKGVSDSEAIDLLGAAIGVMHE